MKRDGLPFKNTQDGITSIFQKLYDHYGPQRWWPAESPFEVIVGAILTQNTAWANVEKAICNLKQRGLLDPVLLNGLEPEKIAEHIKPSGYYNIKTKRLKSFLNFLFKRFSGSLDKMFKEELETLREGLLNISGIGEETADSILLYAGGYPIFVVDAYTKRVFSRHGFFKSDVSYLDCQRLFMDNLSADAGLFNEYHALIVMVGKDFCKKKEPVCRECPLNVFQ